MFNSKLATTDYFKNHILPKPMIVEILNLCNSDELIQSYLS